MFALEHEKHVRSVDMSPWDRIVRFHASGMRVFSYSDTYVRRHACGTGGVSLLDHHTAVITFQSCGMSR
jgi:hypothetical protein